MYSRLLATVALDSIAERMWDAYRTAKGGGPPYASLTEAEAGQWRTVAHETCKFLARNLPYGAPSQQ